MGLEEMIDEIIETAKKESLTIQNEGKKEAKEILLSGKKKIEERRVSSEKGLNKTIESLEQKELASATLMNKRVNLTAKKEVIDMIYARVIEKVKTLDSKTKKKIYANLLKNAGKQMKPKYIYTNENDAKIARELAKNLQWKKAEILGGFILEDGAQEIRIDYSFDSLLESFMEDKMKDLSQKLFKVR